MILVLLVLLILCLPIVLLIIITHNIQKDIIRLEKHLNSMDSDLNMVSKTIDNTHSYYQKRESEKRIILKD